MLLLIRGNVRLSSDCPQGRPGQVLEFLAAQERMIRGGGGGIEVRSHEEDGEKGAD